jgi:hypothetical protein
MTVFLAADYPIVTSSQGMGVPVTGAWDPHATTLPCACVCTVAILSLHPVIQLYVQNAKGVPEEEEEVVQPLCKADSAPRDRLRNPSCDTVQQQGSLAIQFTHRQNWPDRTSLRNDDPEFSRTHHGTCPPPPWRGASCNACPVRCFQQSTRPR